MFDAAVERADEIYPEATYQEAVSRRPIVQPGFQLPKSIWMTMLGCYGLFFAGMIYIAGNSIYAAMMVFISILYTMIYFGVGAILAGLPEEEERSPLDCQQCLPTWCGPMDAKAVWGQVLIVPAAIGLFGLSVAIIAALL